MTSTKIVLCCCFLFVLCSCGSDPLPSENILGMWDVSEFSEINCINGKSDDREFYGDSTCETSGGETECEYLTINFGANGVVNLRYADTLNGVEDDVSTLDGTYRFIGEDEDILEICFNDECLTSSTSEIKESSMVWTSIEILDNCTVLIEASR